MMVKLSVLFSVILASIYSLYSGQVIIGLTFLFLFAIGMGTVSITLKKNVCLRLYGTFFIIYGLLLILTQYLFIDGRELEAAFFNHNDASESFYDQSIMRYGPNKWKDLINSTVLAAFFGDYPLFALWINMWKLIAIDLGVTTENLRFFLRIQDLLFAPGILAIIGLYLKEIGYRNNLIIRYCTYFGIFSYLFLTSVVFTRDLHVAFFYTLAAYYCLSPNKHRFVYLKFIFIIIVSFGLRPENGMFAVAFPVYFFFRNTKPSVKLFLAGILIVSVLIGMGVLDRLEEAQLGYAEKTAEKAQGGLYSVFNSLPVPLNFVFNSIYSFIMPFPLTMYCTQDNILWFGIPSIGMPFINLLMIFTISSYIKRHIGNYKVLYFFIICVLYIVMCCSIEPNVRRTFAAIPPLYMLFSFVKPSISAYKFNITVKSIIALLLIINIPAIIYLVIKGKILI